LTTGNINRAPAEWAFFTLLTALTGLAGIYLPPLYLMVILVFPLPVILMSLRFDTRYSLLSLVAAGLVMLVVTQYKTAVFILIFQYGLLGIIYGLLFKNRVSSGQNIALGIAGSVALSLIVPAFIYILSGENLFALGEEGRRVAEQWVAANQGAGAFNNLSLQWQGNLSEKVVDIYETLIPGQQIISSAFAAAVTYFLARVALHRMSFTLPPAPAFTRMFYPWYSIWGLIAGLALTMAGDYFSFSLAAKAGKNILLILFYAYLILGLSVTVYYFRKIKLAWPFKAVFLLLAVAYIPVSISLVLLVGVVDPLVNLRRLPEVKG